jgi:hypothetical protein
MREAATETLLRRPAFCYNLHSARLPVPSAPGLPYLVISMGRHPSPLQRVLVSTLSQCRRSLSWPACARQKPRPLRQSARSALAAGPQERAPRHNLQQSRPASGGVDKIFFNTHPYCNIIALAECLVRCSARKVVIKRHRRGAMCHLT